MLDELIKTSKPLRQTTLCFLTTKESILLAMKKRGFGAGNWNGMGGKMHPGEAITDAVIRETQEEIGITPLMFQQVALLHFYFPEQPEDIEWNQAVHVYFCTQWVGEPKETEEMAPQWFARDAIPYEQMWEDDKYWLPSALSGTYVKGYFQFNAAAKLVEYKIVPDLAKALQLA